MVINRSGRLQSHPLLINQSNGGRGWAPLAVGSLGNVKPTTNVMQFNQGVSSVQSGTHSVHWSDYYRELPQDIWDMWGIANAKGFRITIENVDVGVIRSEQKVNRKYLPINLIMGTRATLNQNFSVALDMKMHIWAKLIVNTYIIATKQLIFRII